MNVIVRVKKILFQPQTEWLVIDAERTTTQELYTGYIVPLAAIGPLAMLIGLSTMGINVPFVGTMQVPFSSLVTQTIVTYVMGLAGIYVLALIINAFAPMYSGVGNMSQALKVTAYSATSAWVGGIFNLVPALSLLGLLASAYTLYLLYLGLPVLMKSPPERAMGYTVTVIIAAVVLFVEQLGKNLETFTKGLERAGQAGARESGETIRRTKNAIGAAKSQCWSISAVSFKSRARYRYGRLEGCHEQNRLLFKKTRLAARRIVVSAWR